MRFDGIDVRATSPAARAACAEALEWARRNPRDRGERRELAGIGVVWCKGGPLRRHAPLRHGVARMCGREAPRVREFDSLRAFDAAGIPAAAPVFAAAHFRGGRLRAQVLATAFLPRTASVDEHRTALSVADRLALAALAGRALGKLHAARFEHRDAYARNLLVDVTDLGRCWWIDAWRASMHGGPRGLSDERAARDVARALLEGSSAWSERERSRYLEAYEHARGDAWKFPRDFESRIERALRRERARARALARRDRVNS